MSKTDLAAQIAALPPEKRAALLAKLREQEKGKQKERKEAEAIPQVARGAEGYELSFAQQRLWFLNQFDQESAEYNIPIGYRLRGEIDPKLLRRALLLLIDRHESLRTVFRATDGEPRQVILPSAEIALPVVDLRPRHQEVREKDARFEMSVDARRPFDLQNGPVIRGTLFQVEDREFLLYLNVHHITFDGWSNGILIRELKAIYEALARGASSELPPMPIQYLDFAVWQRGWLQGKTLEDQLAYWKKQIAGTPPLELATDRPRPAVRTSKGTTFPILIDEELTGKLEELGRKEGCTLFVTLLAAFRTLLSRYTNQDDFGIGTLIANRTRPELEGLIGFFANTLALRTEIGRETTFRQLMAQERRTAYDAYDHQDLPFEKVVEELSPERDLSRTPYFQVMFILQNQPTGQAGERAEQLMEISGLGVDSETSKFELTLYLTQGKQVTGFFEYNRDLFDRSTIERLTHHYLVLLCGIAENPDRRLAAYELMTEDERRQVVLEWNDTAAEYPDVCLHQLFERQAADRPDAVALVAEDVSYTYRELDEKANRLANLLIARGLPAESFVGVCTDRSSNLVVALLGVLKAGCAYLPMDPGYPADRLAFMIEDSRAKVVLCLSSLEDKLPEFDGEVLLLDEAQAELEAASAERPALRALPGNLAYVIHTSGSTGKPKGVIISHQAVTNFLISLAQRPGLDASDVLLAVTTISFDIAGLELYLPLAVGAKLVLASREIASAGEKLLDKLKSDGITVMQATPATWQLLYGAGWPGDPDLKVLCGGEALSPELADRLLRSCKSVWNVYGPTEATIWSTVHRVDADDGKAGSVSIGRPIANTRIYIVDRLFQPVPIGVPGELLIGGDGLARGYLGRPDLACERFVADPFAGGVSENPAAPGQRLYRTGDLVRYTPDGRISFLGRIDFQVKVRGYRIELGEIETVLDHHPAIEKSVVITREDTPGSIRLVAYLVGPGGPDSLPKGPELKDFLKKKLPEYMVPAIFVPLSEMPLTPNGKINRRALPKPDPSLLRTKEFVPPREGKESQLAAIWQKTLDLKEVGAEDDFFDLGGDSLLVIRMITAAKKDGLVFTTKQVFQHKTIAELCKVEGSSTILAEQGPIVGEVALTPAMHQFLEVGHPHPEWHSLGAFISAKQGSFDLPALEGALRKVLEHHDTLRMHLSEKDGRPVMVCDPPWETLPLEIVELRGADEETEKSTVQGHLSQLIRSFDMRKPPLVKAVLYQTDTPFLFFFGHFLVADIGSWTTILDDFDTAYRNLSRGEKLELQPKTTAFRDWVGRLVERANGPEIESEKAYWTDERIKDTALMPLDFPQGENRMRSSQSVYLDLDEDFSETLLKKIPRATGAQIDAIILTAVLYAIEEWTGNRSLRINLLGHGREPLYDDIDTTRSVGWFNTIYPAYLTLGDAPHPAAALKQVNKQLRAIPNAGLGFGLLRYLSRDEETVNKLKELPPPQIFFNYFGSDHRSELTVISKDDQFGGYGYDLETARLCPIAVAGIVNQDKFLRIRFEFSKNLHLPETIEKVAAKTLATLEKLRVNH
jgi:amino acid adenylation domain-containing protein/non-ribosomal peptide synthase protein (TIGR01720 family)